MWNHLWYNYGIWMRRLTKRTSMQERRQWNRCKKQAGQSKKMRKRGKREKWITSKTCLWENDSLANFLLWTQYSLAVFWFLFLFHFLTINKSSPPFFFFKQVEVSSCTYSQKNPFDRQEDYNIATMHVYWISSLATPLYYFHWY